MTYQSLYRRYRPSGFEHGFIGQFHIVRTLQNSLASNRLTHAYLFSGPRGTGKTTTAKIFAKAVNCLSAPHPVADPCNQCQTCIQVNDGSSMDVMELDAATNRGIEEVRDLRDRVKYAPALGRFKVYIVDEVHMLTTEAFNALLKTLEEPPGHVIFVLATTEPQKVPATILSRCQRFDFRPLTEEQIASHLQHIAAQSGVSLSDNAARVLAFRAQGGMRDALGLLEQTISYSEGIGSIDEGQVWESLGTLDRGKLQQLADVLASKDIKSILTMLDDYGKSGVDFHQLMVDLLDLLRENLLVSSGARAGSKGSEVLKLPKDIMLVMDAVAEGLQESRRWSHPRLAVELMAVKYCNKGSVNTVSSDKEQNEPKEADKDDSPVKSQPAPTEDISRDKWEEVLALVKKESISSYAWLKEAHPQVEDGCIILNYPENYMLHRDNVSKGEHQQIIVPVLKKKLGINQYQARSRD